MTQKKPGRPAASVLVVPPLGALLFLIVLAPFQPFAAVTSAFFLLLFALVFVVLGQVLRRTLWTAPRIHQPLAAQTRQTLIFSSVAVLAWLIGPAVTVLSETGQYSQSTPLDNLGQLLLLALPLLLVHIALIALVTFLTNRQVPARA